MPDQVDAHKLMADYYRRLHEAAEQAGDTLAAARHELHLREHDRGQHTAYLDGRGTLTLTTEPSGATVELLRCETRARRIHEQSLGPLGTTPLTDVSLPIGRYIAVVTAPGRREVRYPFVIQRESAQIEIPPGASKPAPVVLPLTSELGEAELVVPCGWYSVGGDAQAAGGLPGRRIWIDAFAITRFPVTHAEYAEYLDDLMSREGREAIEAVVPRATSGPDGVEGAALYEITDGGVSCGALDPAAAVTNIDWHSAHSYACWLAQRTGLPWRLPCELEWERAARGGDGRSFPWGDQHDPSWCCTMESHEGQPAPPTVDSYPVDASPYGVRGMGGGVRDWCLDEFRPEGPEVSADRLVIAEPSDGDNPHITRGGAWSLPDWVARACCRGYHPPIRLADLGFRLVRGL